MPQDSHPSEGKHAHITLELHGANKHTNYQHLEDETSSASELGEYKTGGLKHKSHPTSASGVPLVRLPLSENRETSSREEWLKFVKEQQKELEQEKREFQRNLPRKAAHFIKQQLYTKEMFLSTVFLLFFASALVASRFKRVTIAGVELYHWGLFVGTLVWGYVFVKFIVRRIIKLSKRFRFFEAYVYYFIHSSYHSLTSLIVAAVVFPFWTSLVPNLQNDKVNHYFDVTFVVIIMLSATNLVRAVGTKLLTGMVNKNHFHSQIVNALFNERMLVNLLMPSKRTQALPKKTKIFSMKDLLGDVELRKFHSMSRLVQRRSFAALGQELESWDEINSTEKARELAQRVFKNIDRTNKGFITKQDVSNFIKPKYVNKVFSVFDVDGDGKVVKEEVEELVIRIYRERNALSNGLKDRENMGLVLTKIITFVFWIVMFFITLYVYGVPILDWVTPFAAFFVGFGFIFGESLRDIFSSIIFIFVVHPFDVGDRICVDTIMTVESIHLLTTHFFTLEGKHVIIKNSTLATKPIQNFKRSRIANHPFELQIDFNTSMDKIADLRSSISSYIASHPKIWKPDLHFWITDLARTNRVNIQFWCTTRFTWQEGPTNWRAKTDMYFHVKRRMMELGIKYYAPPQHTILSTGAEEKQFLSQLCAP